jgi:hypothetical protein
MSLHTNAGQRFRQWNDVVDAVKAVLHPLVKKKVTPVLRRLELPGGPKAVEDCVRWDVLHACMELEYADVCRPGFGNGLMRWYLAGRFPCGWGELAADGKIRLRGPVEEVEYHPAEPDPLQWVLSEQERVFAPKVRMLSGGKLVVY